MKNKANIFKVESDEGINHFLFMTNKNKKSKERKGLKCVLDSLFLC